MTVHYCTSNQASIVVLRPLETQMNTTNFDTLIIAGAIGAVAALVLDRMILRRGSELNQIEENSETGYKAKVGFQASA